MEKTKKLYEYKLKSFQDNFENEIKILKDATDVMKNSLELKTKEVVAVKENEVKPQKEVATYSEISRDLDDKVKAHVEEMNIIKQDLDDQELSCKEKDGRISELEGKLSHVEMDQNIVKGEQESELLKHQQLKANLSKSNNLNEKLQIELKSQSDVWKATLYEMSTKEREYLRSIIKLEKDLEDMKVSNETETKSILKLNQERKDALEMSCKTEEKDVIIDQFINLIIK